MNWNESVEVKNSGLNMPWNLMMNSLQRVQDIHRLGALQGHLGWDQVF